MIIYLADDDLEDRQFFTDALTELPLKIRLKTFQNGVALIADLFSDEELPEVIFLDLKMPMMDGFECLSDIRSEAKFNTINVIIYATPMNNWETKRLEKMSANRYLQKPTSFNQLKTILYNCLSTIKSNKHKKMTDNLYFSILK